MNALHIDLRDLNLLVFRLELLPPPVELEGFTVSQLWHERMQHDPAHAWLRKTIADVSQQSASTTTPGTTGRASRPTGKKP